VRAARRDRGAAPAGADGGHRPRRVRRDAVRLGRRLVVELLHAQHTDAAVDRMVRRGRRARVDRGHGPLPGRRGLPDLPVGRGLSLRVGGPAGLPRRRGGGGWQQRGGGRFLRRSGLVGARGPGCGPGSQNVTPPRHDPECEKCPAGRYSLRVQFDPAPRRGAPAMPGPKGGERSRCEPTNSWSSSTPSSTTR
jgi:hypothetical protein